jgi:hypothetical protein
MAEWVWMFCYTGFITALFFSPSPIFFFFFRCTRVKILLIKYTLGGTAVRLLTHFCYRWCTCTRLPLCAITVQYIKNIVLLIYQKKLVQQSIGCMYVVLLIMVECYVKQLVVWRNNSLNVYCSVESTKLIMLALKMSRDSSFCSLVVVVLLCSIPRWFVVLLAVTCGSPSFIRSQMLVVSTYQGEIVGA